MDIQNHQKLMEILNMHATIRLQTKFEAKMTKIAFLALRLTWAYLGLPDETWLFEISKYLCGFLLCMLQWL